MNKNQTWRRVLTLICVMAMLIGIMVVGSVVASAEETDAAVLTYEVDTYEELIAALANDGAHVRMTADITATATQSSGYGKAGIVVGAGDVLDGNGKKLTINGAGGTWDCAIAMTGGEVKNLTIAGAMRGIFMPGANDDVVIDNCVFVNVIYTFNSDAGSKNHTVTIKNTKLNGWTSFSNVHKSVIFESCTFGEGSGYAFCRPYQATTFVDCDFAAGYELDNKNIPAADVLTFNDCTYAGEALSSENNDMFYNGGSVIIDGETADVNHYVVAIGANKYLTLQAAVDAVQNGDTVTLLADVTENVTLTEKTGLYYTIDGDGKKFNGTITVNSLSDTNDNRRITIKNVNFVNTADAGRDFISSVDTNHYPRLTVEGCTFTGNGNDTDVAVRLKSSHSVVIKDCTGSGLHSFLQNTSGWNLTVENVTVTDSKSGLALGTVQGVTVKGCDITVDGYGVRLDAQYNNNAVLAGNTVKAFIPVVVRKATVDGNITVESTNAFTATNTDGYWIVIGNDEYETNGVLPEAGTGNITVNVGDKRLEGAYGAAWDYKIWTVDDLIKLDKIVEGGNMLEGVTIYLMNDIDLSVLGKTEDDEPVTFSPIGANKAYFKGTFDGQGHTIKNMYQSGWALGYDWDHYGTIGLFAYLWNATIKNLTIENAECFVEGGNVAAIAGCAWGDCTFENVTVKNSTYATYNNRAAGIVGYTGGEGTMTFKKITVDENTVIAGLWGSFDSSLGGVVGSIQDPTKFVFEDVTVKCRLDAYNDVTAAYKYYAYRMCGMLIGKLPVDDNNQPILTNVTIGDNVTIDYSNTPDYTYTNASGSWKRVEAGYAYGGVDMTQYPDAEVIYKPLNSMFGGQQYGSYGQDDHEDIVAEGREAEFDGEYFTSVENAFKAADGAKDAEGNPIPVKLMADYSGDIVITKSLNINLNGYSFTGNVTTVEGYNVEFSNGVYTAVEIPKIYVSTKAELNAALAAAQEGYIILLTADIDYGTDQLAITKAITLDLGGHTLTTRNAWGGMSVKGNATVKNGKIVHASNTAAIKVWNATAFEDLVIDVQGKGDANKTIGGIVLQEGSTTRVGSIKNVTIEGAALTNGIETYNCGDATENVIDSLENVTINAAGTGMLISAPVGTATNCTIKGGVNAVELWIKGTYSATLTLVDCDLEGGVYAHDEFSSNPDIVNNGTLKLTVDAATTGVDVTLELARAEKVEGVLETIKENAQAKVNNVYYATLAEAMAAAKSGDTVTILEGNYTGNLSVNKAITVVGEGTVKFNGKLSITANGATVKNLNFTNSGTACYVNAKDVTIDGCTLVGSNGLYQSYTTGKVTIKNSTITGGTYGVNFDGSTGGEIVIEGCTITGWTSFAKAIKKVTITDTTFENGSYNFVRFYQENVVIDGCTFNKNMKVDFAVDGANVTVTDTTLENGNVENLFYGSDMVNSTITVDGVKLVRVAKIGDTYYATIAEAIAAAQSGDTVTLLAGDYTVDISVKSGVTLAGETDAQGNNLVNITGRVSATTGATVMNLNIHNEKTGDYDCALAVNGKDIVIDGVQLTGYNGMRYCYANGDITIKNSVINASFFALHFDGSAGGNLVIDDCHITGWVSYAGTIEKVTLKDSTFDAGAYAGQRSYTKNLVIDGCTFEAGYKLDINATDANVVVNNSKMADGSSIADLFHGEDVVAGDFTIDGSELTYVAKIGNTHYATLEEALAAVADWTTIKLVANATLNYGARETYGRGTTTDIIIDGQGFTLTLNQTNSDWSSIGMVNANGKLTLKNMTIEKTGYGDTTGAWNTHAIIFSCNVEMNNVTVNNSVAVQNGATLNNVTINEANEYYGLWINGNGQTVTANVLNINATNGGRGIKIADQYIDTPASVTLNISDAKFNTAKKAAVLVTSTAGAKITASNVDITNVAKDSANLVWVDSDRAEYYGNVTVTGEATKGQEDVDSFAASVAKNGNVIGYYTSLADAFAVAQDGETIKLLANIALDETITNTKKVTLDLNGKTITGTDNATGSFGLINNKGTLTITGNGTITLEATNERNWNAYSSVISNQVGGKLVVESGTIEHLGGTAMAYAIDNLTNGKGTYAETVINGGTIKSTYRAIRQFLNGVEAQNILTVNGGTIEGTNKAIWMQDPSKNANSGKLTVGENAVIKGDIYLFVTAGSTEWPVTVSIAASAVNGKVLTGNVPGGLTVKNVNGVYVVAEGLSGSGTEADPYLINNLADLLWFQKEVDKQAADGSTQFAGKYFKLTADLDLAGINWNPIGSMSGDHGSFLGIFDGDNHTISNLYVEQAGNGLGLFARTAGNAVIKNLNLQNVTVKSTNNSNYVGGLVGNAYASTKIENVHVTGDVYISGRGYIGGIAGHGYVVMDNVSVVANEGSIVTSTFWCAGGILGYAGEGTTNIMNAHVKGLTITSAAGGLGAIVGMAEDNKGTQPISGSNLSAKNVEIKTYVGAYGTAYENYAIGYLYGGNETSKLTGVLSVENVTLTNASGNTPNVVDAVATVNGVVYFNLQEAIKAAAPNGTVELLRNTTVDEWKMITTKTIATGQLITLTINGLTIDGKGHTLTIKDVESAGNGGYLFDDAKNLTIKNLTINQPDGCGGIDLESGVIENVTINGGWYGVVPGSEGVTITGCTFNDIVKHAIYIDEARNGIVITGNTFNTASGAYATIMYGNEVFTNNTILTGRVNLTNSSSATVSGNDFGTERFKVYNGSTAIITDNKINNLVFNDPTDFVESTFTNNTLSTDAQAAIDALPTPVAKIGNVKYKTLAAAIAAAKAGDTVTVFEGTYAMPSMKAGITLEGEGKVIFEGTLSGTLENLTLKNIHIKGSNAQRWAYAKGNLVFENVTFEATSIYALHFDGIAEGTNLTYKNCTIIGWAAMGGTPASATFDGCTFKGNGTYGVIRTYFDATITNCIFDVKNVNTNDAYQDGIHAVEGAEVIVTGCTNVNGSMEDIVNVHSTSVVNVDGKEIKNVAIVGGNYYTSLQAAIEAAAELYLQDKNQVPVIKLFADCAENVHIGDHDKHVDLTLALDLNGKAYTGTVSLNNGSALIAPDTISVVAIPVGSGLTYVFDRWVATNHQLLAPVVVPPTCVAQGYTVYKCSQPGCDVEFRGNYVAVNPDNHNYVAGTVVAPTVNTQGYTVYTCSYCGNSENRDFKPVLVAVAEINGTRYATLQEAIDAVQTGETVTIKLISDINYDGSEAHKAGEYNYSIINLVAGQKVIIDFNGYTINAKITAATELTGQWVITLFFVQDGAEITFVDNSTEGNGGIKAEAGTHRLYCFVYNCNSTVTIAGGNYVAKTGSLANCMIYADLENTTYIKGGNFKLADFTADGPWYSNVEGKHDGSLVIYTGGTFDHNLLINAGTKKDCEINLPNGYVVVDNGTTWSVIKVAAKVNGQYFETLADAMAYCNKAEGDYTIELVADVDEVISFKQNKNVNITIDGNNKAFVFTGKITLTTGYGELKFTNTVITPKNSHTVYINAQSTPNVTFDNCILAGEGSGAIVWGQYSGGNAYITIKNCEASNLTYIVNIRQGGYHVYAEYIKASDMTYLFRTNKCADVYVKNVEAEKVVIPFEIKNDSTGTLTLENVTVDICPYSDGKLYAPVNGKDPDSTNTAHTFNIVLKGDTYFTHEGVEYDKTEWLVGNAGYKVILIDSVSGNLNFKEDIGFTFTFNTKYALRDDYKAVITVAGEKYEIYAKDWNANKATINLFAKQMTDEITVVVMWGDREISKTITTSVRAYYDAGVKAELFSAKDLELLNAMLHYGAAAQKAFGYNTGKLANDGVEAPANVAVESKLEAERYFGSTLNLDSHIVFNFKFLRDSLDVAYAEVNGKVYEVTYETNASVGQLVVVKVDDLYITDANELLTCTLYDAEGNELRTAKDSVTRYCARAITGLTNLKNSNLTAYEKQAVKEDFYQALANYVNALSVYKNPNSNTNTNEGGENS